MQESRPRPFDIDHAGHVIPVRGTRNFFAIGIADGGIARGRRVARAAGLDLSRVVTTLAAIARRRNYKNKRRRFRGGKTGALAGSTTSRLRLFIALSVPACRR